jgi:mono/diheme cytochrome c family protein
VNSPAVPLQFGHADQTRVHQLHGLIEVFLQQVSDRRHPATDRFVVVYCTSSGQTQAFCAPLGQLARTTENEREMLCGSRNKSSWCCSLQVCAAMVPALVGGAFGAEQPKSDKPGKDLFVKACAPCHSKDGTAQTPAAKKLGVKDLSQSKLTDGEIIQQILEGRQDNQGPSKMPAFKEKLTRPEIDSLIPIVKSFRK